MLSINTLSGRGNIVNYTKKSNGSYEITWGRASFFITQKIIDDFLTNFFVVKDDWYKLGASVEPIIEDGFVPCVAECILKFLKWITKRLSSEKFQRLIMRNYKKFVIAVQ